MEIGNAEYNYLIGQGYDVRKDIASFGNKRFQVITSFHVLEHLADPVKMLRGLLDYLTEDGILILETPNADDALLELYKCEAFADFTYWSPHVYLYNSENIKALARQSGYDIVTVKQVQRYPLANHMYWLANGKPGGHVKWEFLQSERLDKAYYRKLEELGACDTLMAVLKPRRDPNIYQEG